MAAPKTTVLTGDTTDKAQTTTPGDAPADTYDPTEIASKVVPDYEAAADAGEATVNSVIVVDSPYVAGYVETREAETIFVADEHGALVEVTHDIGTGATTVDTP